MKWIWHKDFNLLKRIADEVPGATWKTIKQNPSLIPIHLCIISGYIICFATIARTLTVNPEVQWNNHADREPWERYRYKNYRVFDFYNIFVPCEAPIYRKPGESWD